MPQEQEDKVVKLHVPGDAESLGLVRAVVTHLARQLGFTDVDVDKIEIAVDEACTNVLEHGYRFNAPKPPVQLEIKRTANQLTVDIIDKGFKFDFNNYVPPEFPDHWAKGHTRGAGLYLIKKCVDKVVYEHLPGVGNRLSLTKALPESSKA